MVFLYELKFVLIELNGGQEEMIILAILATIIVGWMGAAFGLEIMNGFTELGSILAVAIMGAFIMLENKRINKK